MSSSQPPMPAYGDPVPDRDRLPWSRVIARMILVILPGLLVGSFAGGVIVTVLGVQLLRSVPVLPLVIPLLAGLITGVGLGLVIKPARDQLGPCAGVAAAIAAAAYLAFVLVARLRVPGAAANGNVLGYLLGALIVVIAQVAVSLLLWLRRIRTSRS